MLPNVARLEPDGLRVMSRCLLVLPLLGVDEAQVEVAPMLPGWSRMASAKRPSASAYLL